MRTVEGGGQQLRARLQDCSNGHEMIYEKEEPRKETGPFRRALNSTYMAGRATSDFIRGMVYALYADSIIPTASRRGVFEKYQKTPERGVTPFECGFNITEGLDYLAIVPTVLVTAITLTSGNTDAERIGLYLLATQGTRALTNLGSLAYEKYRAKNIERESRK